MKAWIEKHGKRYRVRWREGAVTRSEGPFDRKRDADTFLLDLRRRAALGGLYEAPSETFGTFVDGWLTRYERRVSPSSFRRTLDLKKHLDARSSRWVMPGTGFLVKPAHSEKCYLHEQGREEFIVYEGTEYLDRIGRRSRGGTTWHKFRCNCLDCDAVAYVRWDVLMVIIAGLVHASKEPVE